MRVGSVGLVDEFGGAGAPFFGSVVVFGHESEKEVEEVMRRFW